MAVSFVVAFLALAPAHAVQAQTAEPAAEAHALDETADFWREVRQPGYQRSRVLLRHGIRMLLRLREERRPHVRAAILEGALERFQRAHLLVPEDAEVLYELARATALYERPRRGQPAERRDEEAITLFERLRALDPDLHAEQVGFELGILYTRVGRYEEAAAEYRRALRYVYDEDFAAITHSNLAEVRMMAGALEDAVHHYERAIAHAEQSGAQDPRSLALALFGAAVALDRLGEHRAALEHAARARGVFGGNQDVLRADGVFFEPASEIHYYEGLGHMAAAERDVPSERAGHLRDARESWRTYLALSAEDDPWNDLAERHLEEVERALAEAPRQARSRDPE
ncbi:MAG TPA: tetratricopeptide repeat protein [Polyangiaceae bacterium LLY-WYZ-15_(1-7)]|nr:tetratricopeptide repeat protein [Polyangiaceae bacterium LLY-WYZ-15_(1-7)]HJL07308.1 tetratricopeptide repeat protein [Polyangiaceae bacterium LLY-WYZ-15_(1-7)]HJL23227.1 tetratricopeptide repeat protein [Polyangiaceae bacterium LLY-WYZ-15_(1-7)]HJL30938.1 tetratricopeptide repeat protein [Polyangiaceae bacterium LLY-WYZ-15_(1-7)]HJL48334.1 tetratricopeptide repeat protein [Polyangiaceae bacterium LLY-WYZ-15_(1-7)]